MSSPEPLETEDEIDALIPPAAVEAVRLHPVLPLRTPKAAMAAREEFASPNGLALIAACEVPRARAGDEPCFDVDDEYDLTFSGVTAIDPSRTAHRRW